MILRIIGAIMILVGCGYAGFLLAASYRKETDSLTSFIEMLNYFECELQYRSPPISDMFSDFSETRKDLMGRFSKTLAVEIESQVCPNVKECVRAALQKHENMPKETACFLIKFGTTLGKFNADGQLLEIRSLKSVVQQKLEFLLSNQDWKTRNYKTLGLCAGAAIAILFI